MSVKVWNSTGALVVIPLSGAVPSSAVYNAGAAYDPGGSLYVYPITGAVPATAVYLAGLAYTQDGALYVTADTPAGSIYQAGLRVNATGAVYVTGAAVANQNLPIPLWGYATTTGALYVDGGFFAPLSDAGAGAVTTTDLLGGLTASFTRATVAWTKLSTGLWAEVASGTARSVYTGADTAVGTYAGYYSELAATNLAVQARDWTQADWADVVGTMTRAKTSIGIDGAANSCTRLTATGAGDSIAQTVTAAGATRTFSVWIRRVTGTGDITLAVFNDASGPEVSGSLSTTTFTRFEMTTAVANPQFGLQFETSGDAIDVDFGQLETGAAASSPIATTVAAVTRNADVLVYTSAPDFGAQGSMYCEATPFIVNNGANRSALSVDNGTANERVTITMLTGAPTSAQLIVVDGSVTQAQVSVASQWTTNTTTKGAASWTTNLVNFAANGTLGTEDTTATMPTSDRVMVGGHAGAVQWSGGVKNVRAWKTVFRRGELSRMTT